MLRPQQYGGGGVEWAGIGSANVVHASRTSARMIIVHCDATILKKADSLGSDCPPVVFPQERVPVEQLHEYTASRSDDRPV